MKKTLLIITLFITGVCFAQKYEGMEFYDNGQPKSIKTYKESNDKFELIKSISVYENGQKSSEKTYMNGLRNGKWTYWYENGEKWKEGPFKDGKEDGLWTYWDNDGSKYEGKVIRKDDEDGTFLYWYDNEKTKIESHKSYKDGELDGLYTRWDENGQKLLKGTFKDGERDGLWTYYTEVGNGKYEVTYKAGIYTTAVFTDSLGIDYTGSPITDESEQDGIFFFQDDEGGEYDFSYFPLVFVTTKDGEFDGLFTQWYKNGQKEAEGTAKDGELDGLMTEWYENGQKSSKKTYKDGGKDGLYTIWYDNGEKEEEGTYKDGKLNGLMTEWFENGQKEKEGTFKDWELDGLYTIWYENGEKEEEGTLKDGELDGLYTSWYENGQKEYEGIYKDGELIIDPDEVEGPRVKFIPYDDPPMPLTPIRPKYPEIAQEAGIEGTVVIQVFVDKKGRVKETVVLKGIPNTGLDEAAVDAIRSVRFKPAKQRGRAIGVWISIPVNFRLKS